MIYSTHRQNIVPPRGALPPHAGRAGVFGERVTADGRRVQDGRHNRSYPGQRLSAEPTPYLPHATLESTAYLPRALFKALDDESETDDTSFLQRSLWSRLRHRRASSSSAEQDTFGHMQSRQRRRSADRERVNELQAEAELRDGPGPYELYGQLDHEQLVDLYAAVKQHDASWVALRSLPRDNEWTFTTIPWPTVLRAESLSDLSPSSIRLFLLASLGSGADDHARLNMMLVRWQPDEFARRWLACVRSDERAKVQDGVDTVWRVLRALQDEVGA